MNNNGSPYRSVDEADTLRKDNERLNDEVIFLSNKLTHLARHKKPINLFPFFFTLTFLFPAVSSIIIGYYASTWRSGITVGVVFAAVIVTIGIVLVSVIYSDKK